MLPMVTDMFIQCRNVRSLAALARTEFARCPRTEARRQRV